MSYQRDFSNKLSVGLVGVGTHAYRNILPTIHGAIPWKSEQDRRSILTRYTAGNLAYVPAYPVPEWADNRQRSVMEPPYHSRLNRPILDK